MYNRDRSAAETCLSLPEIVFQVGSYLFEPSDLYAASCVNRLWQAALLPILCNDTDDDADDDADDDDNKSEGSNDPDFEPESDVDMNGAGGDTERTTTTHPSLIKRNKDPLDLEPIVGILNHLADNGKLQFFMYALPGEPFEALPDEVWLALRRMSDTLQGLYIELIMKHWNPFLSSRFNNIHYLRLFLDTDEELPPGPNGEVFDPKAALLTFLQSHPRLQVLHLYLGTVFANLALSSITLPSLKSFLLISKAENVDVAPFIKNHTGLTSLDVYTDSDFEPFPADTLQNVQALQVSAMTVSWFRNVLAAAPKRAQPIRHLQITAARQENFLDVLSLAAPLGSTLRCLELIFWSRDVPLIRVLEEVSRTFPRLVELSLFIPSWGSAEWDEEENGPLDLTSMLKCFASNRDLLAFAVSDPKTDLLDKEQIEAVPKSSVPPRLEYIIWRSQTFRLRRQFLSPDETLGIMKSNFSCIRLNGGGGGGDGGDGGDQLSSTMKSFILDRYMVTFVSDIHLL
ncbi:uncharacterized protein FOMMEDRAFT_31843 [Fomitiporia mediterranea MF3/22]|uniref:uncharacterized protein n=1 Tax=Fomitiporia mediterranea (strain MF3/22) TaxID=694068 RepID=UPI00044089DD|nr:uncharacterized protein FOMMEDRAFT_31843 [Fomitiporia mediterranea MF3/22]EJC98367.1 hypothetical protein FOMMEDRAFT_31843 [Fomitiporia mediterranea MF3/22]